MELYLNTTSPYARLVRILVLEQGLEARVTLRWCDPWSDDPALLAVNPAGRIPALVTDEGVTLSESALIIHYLTHLAGERSLLPDAQLPRVLHQAGLGQALMDAAFTTVISRKYQPDDPDNSLLGQRRWRAIRRILAQLASELPASTTTAPTLGDISIAVALDYLSFRLSEYHWQQDYPELATWLTSLLERPSFEATCFPR